ncbi:MAG TPA: protein kinase, partial [Myxococcaceae bacterium]|nr:protein kinase [Myxococcaceae bacterium]
RLPVYVDAFREEDGQRARLYLAYRYLEGVSLAQEMEERRYSEEEVLGLMEEVLEILRHLHGLQPPLIHRDLKPANLVRRTDGTIALIDFGVARDLDRTVNSGTLVGTVGYMPPEQLAGQVDLTCDLYALGATALHLLMRRPPWEFMDGPELRLPRLKSAPTAGALLRRLLAPRRSHRFSSAREALAALRRMRSGGSRVPRTAWAAAGIVALTAGAAGYGLNRRLETQQAPATAAATWPQNPSPQARPGTRASAPLLTASATLPPTAPPVAPRTESVPLVRWKGGSLGRSEVEDGLRRLPPWLKVNRPWWIQQHVMALVRRKLLVAEAERRGMAAPLSRSAVGAERERLLARALLEDEARKEADPVPARALRKAWERTTDALASAAEVQFDESQLFAIDPEKLFVASPLEGALSSLDGRVEFYSRTGRCVLEVETGRRRYGGICEGSKRLADALVEPENLHLVDLAPGSVAAVAFYTRLTDDFVEFRRPIGDPFEAARRAEDSMARAHVQLAETTGTIAAHDAVSLLWAVKPALLRCLAVALSQAQSEPLRATARIRVEIRPGGSASSGVESSPKIPADGCGTALARPEVGGAGTMTFVAELERTPRR